MSAEGPIAASRQRRNIASGRPARFPIPLHDVKAVLRNSLSGSTGRNPNLEIRNKFKIQMFQTDYSDFCRMAPKTRISSLFSWTSLTHSVLTVASSWVTTGRSQYRVSFDSFLEMRIRLKNPSTKCLVCFDIIGSDRTRRTHNLLYVLRVADRKP